jgi:hypothetical protein
MRYALDSLTSMLRNFLRWWYRLADRRLAARRSAEVGRWRYAPDLRHSALGKPRFGRFETLFHPRRWLLRLLAIALAVGITWIFWESWRGLQVFNY